MKYEDDYFLRRFTFRTLVTKSLLVGEDSLFP
jgi:hypothetical protein